MTSLGQPLRAVRRPVRFEGPAGGPGRRHWRRQFLISETARADAPNPGASGRGVGGTHLGVSAWLVEACRSRIGLEAARAHEFGVSHCGSNRRCINPEAPGRATQAPSANRREGGSTYNGVPSARPAGAGRMNVSRIGDCLLVENPAQCGPRTATRSAGAGRGAFTQYGNTGSMILQALTTQREIASEA